MHSGHTRRVIIVASACLALSASSGLSQTRPWVAYEDDVSDSVCDAVNAANARLVVLSDTGQLVLVTGGDVTLEDSLVDASGFVYFEGDPAGMIDFALDGDGFRTLWWTSLTGYVVNVNGFTGQPTETDLFPRDFTGAACDACDFWDDPLVCPQADGGEGSDDLLPLTINFCGMNTQASLALTLAGLGFMSLTRRRPACPRTGVP